MFNELSSAQKLAAILFRITFEDLNPMIFNFYEVTSLK